MRRAVEGGGVEVVEERRVVAALEKLGREGTDLLQVVRGPSRPHDAAATGRGQERGGVE